MEQKNKVHAQWQQQRMREKDDTHASKHQHSKLMLGDSPRTAKDHWMPDLSYPPIIAVSNIRGNLI